MLSLRKLNFSSTAVWETLITSRSQQLLPPKQMLAQMAAENKTGVLVIEWDELGNPLLAAYQ